eukprot:snap_masked-scaffold_12-processed-gene-4.17-mRNA-1 protein AED:0.51 eAED:0.52 QI:0/0/0/0.5/1/1/2/0/159
MKGKIKKGAWTKEEDEQLMFLMSAQRKSWKLKSKKRMEWKYVERCMSGRSAKQCRERWLLCLDPSINKSTWSREEDEEIIRLQSILGNKWVKIKALLNTNRTENSVKLRFHKIMKYGTPHFERPNYEPDPWEEQKPLAVNQECISEDDMLESLFRLRLT